MRHLVLASLAVGALASGNALAAQSWNGDSVLALVRRGVERRSSVASDTALRDYKAQAHGFLFFLGQFGEGLTAPPRLVKADQLELEVYWKAPGLSKQRIVGWRDQADLPTDIVYHRDHLGIVQNNFGPAIRLGDGDEVRDVPHPLGPAGPDLYDYALGDSTTITLPQRVVRVVGVRVRPKDWSQARIVGTVFLDATTGDLVRMAFNFTAHAYLDPQLEDVSVVLDSELQEGRYWLPYRQEIEIRRRGTWLDIPARGIIRGRWIVDSYQLNVGLARTWFTGEEISAVPKAERDSFPWREPLAAAVQTAAGPVRGSDLAAVRAQVEDIAGRHAISGLKQRLVGAQSVSDLARWNRVEGLALGAGTVWRGGSASQELRVSASYGFADRRAKGRVRTSARMGGGTVQVEGYRVVRDVSDTPVIAPLLNSLGAQELGDDYGDYYLATGARVAYRHAVGTRGEWSGGVGREAIAGLPVRAQPADGASTMRPNPGLGGPDVDIVQLAVRRKSEGLAVARDVAGDLALEAGRVDDGARYVRVAGAGQLLFPLGTTRVLVAAQGGVGSADLPAHRSFVLGGRGTLLGDEFRRWGGRRTVVARVEWRVPAPFPSLAVGRYTHTPRSLIVAPYVAAGWSDRPIAGTPWMATPGVRETVGLAVEWLGVFRLEAGLGAQSHRVRFAFDVTRDLWDIL